MWFRSLHGITIIFKIRVLKDKNQQGETALQMALNSHLPLHADHILSMNGKILPSINSFSFFHRFSDCSAPGDETDGGGDDKLVDPNEQDNSGKNALRIAIEKGSPMDLITKLMDG